MAIEKKKYQVFCVQYVRQGETNQWKARTTEAKGLEAINIEKVRLMIAHWEGQTKEDEKHATIHVPVERDPRYFDMSPELEEARRDMLGKANRMADRKFIERHPKAKIERSES